MTRGAKLLSAYLIKHFCVQKREKVRLIEFHVATSAAGIPVDAFNYIIERLKRLTGLGLDDSEQTLVTAGVTFQQDWDFTRSLFALAMPCPSRGALKQLYIDLCMVHS
jgi:hypothetical protein